jgi:hypothetical protein
MNKEEKEMARENEGTFENYLKHYFENIKINKE